MKLRPVRISQVLPASYLTVSSEYCFQRPSVHIRSQQTRFLHAQVSNQLTHIDNHGNVNFVNISEKKPCRREAVAEATVQLSDDVFEMVLRNELIKGDLESTIKLAGITGCKKTSSLIPLCHNIILDHVNVDVVYEPKFSAVQ